MTLWPLKSINASDPASLYENSNSMTTGTGILIFWKNFIKTGKNTIRKLCEI